MKVIRIKKIALLTSENSWIVSYCKNFSKVLLLNYHAELFFDHKDIDASYEVVFILGYTRIIEKEYLKKHLHNLVVHESDLPKGKGWAPLFWQVLEGKNQIPVVLFEASEKVDEGQIYIKDFIDLEGTELNSELRLKQADITFKLCQQFLEKYSTLNPHHSFGEESFYKKRTPKDSRLDIDKTIKDQFNLLRIVDNKDYPAFFDHLGVRYKVSIERYEF